MAPMSSIRTFINALKTGETRTTRALNRVIAERRSAAADERRAALRHPGAMAAPLQPPLRDALRSAALPDEMITECIDRWPDDHKERVRRALVKALAEGHRVRFAWGLTDADHLQTEIRTSGRTVTVSALSPRSSLRVYDEDQVNVAPVRVPSRRRSREGRSRSRGRK
jgi:hypothetical protein